jgi:hypothetical protein
METELRKYAALVKVISLNMLQVAEEYIWNYGAGEDCTARSFINCAAHQMLFRVIKSSRMRWTEHVARAVKGKVVRVL